MASVVLAQILGMETNDIISLLAVIFGPAGAAWIGVKAALGESSRRLDALKTAMDLAMQELKTSVKSLGASVDSIRGDYYGLRERVALLEAWRLDRLDHRHTEFEKGKDA